VSGRVSGLLAGRAGTGRWFVAVFVAGLLLMLGLQRAYRPYAEGGTYFQTHTSEDMMQTVSLLDLRAHLGQSLIALHIQPPLLDAIRGLLAQRWPDARKRALVVEVDRSLYLLWAAVYAAVGAVVFTWARSLSGRWTVGWVAALAVLLHPAAIYYSTFLEGTILTILGMLTLTWSLWSIPAPGATLTLVLSYLLLFLVRSVFQWPALVVVTAALLLRRAPRRTILVFLVATGTVTAAFMAKQYLIFGTVSMSSFAGSNCLNGLGDEPITGMSEDRDTPLGPLFPVLAANGTPEVLTRVHKITRAHNYNNLADLKHERSLLKECMSRVKSQSPQSTLRAWANNMGIFLQPSSRYPSPHAIVDRLPWRRAFDWVFSGPRLLVLVALGLASWARGRTRAELLAGLGLALPALFVSTICVMFEREENMRYKFFVEPILIVFLVTRAASYLPSRAPAAAGAPAVEPEAPEARS